MRGIGPSATDEKVWDRRGGLAAAQDFEALEGGALAQRVIVAARQRGADQRSGRFLAGALSGKHLLAYSAKAPTRRMSNAALRLSPSQAGSLSWSGSRRSFSNRGTGFQPVISGFWNSIAPLSKSLRVDPSTALAEARSGRDDRKKPCSLEKRWQVSSNPENEA